MPSAQDQSAAAAHLPVLCDEVLGALDTAAVRTLVDCTFGRGGHSAALLERLDARARLLALDRDPAALASGRELAARDPRAEFIQAAFSSLYDLLEARALVGRVDALLLDLGVSSPQLDAAERGFSFRQDGPLDMRMDPGAGPSAAEWLAAVDEVELVDTLFQLGEERHARRIARRIVQRRAVQPFRRTLDLADTVAACVGRREPGKHPATRTFQAIRMRINDELGELAAVLEQSLRVLAGGGRLLVISFHSLEDRMVKRFMREHHRGPELPRGLPPPPGLPLPALQRVARARRAGEQEVARNPRARSAVLRVAELRA